MDIKTNLKTFVQERLVDTASPIFLKRALTVIEESSTDKDSLIFAAEKVSKQISLFIDRNLAKEIFENLKTEIYKYV